MTTAFMPDVFSSYDAADYAASEIANAWQHEGPHPCHIDREQACGGYFQDSVATYYVHAYPDHTKPQAEQMPPLVAAIRWDISPDASHQARRVPTVSVAFFAGTVPDDIRRYLQAAIADELTGCNPHA
jgi:hypothetical protein